jgi:hypothetical protein
MSAATSEPSYDVIDAARAASKDASRFTRWLRRPGGLVTPLRVFVVELSSLVEPQALGDIAQPVGWRFVSPRRSFGWRFLPPNWKEPVAIEVSEKYLDVQIERSSFVSGAEQVLRAAEAESRLSDATFEARMLRIPEAHLTALWFTASETSAELVVPLAPAPSEFEPFRPYETQEFLETASSLARRELDLYASIDEDASEFGS